MKQANLSCVRLIATLMIISCHILQGLDLEAAFWLNVGVQIFFVLSGYLYSKKEIKDVKLFYKKQYRKIIVPYIILITIIFTTLKISKLPMIDNKFTLLGIFLGFQNWTGTSAIVSHTWFISYILLCYLITPILKKIKIFNNTENYLKTILGFIALALILQLFISYSVINIIGSYILLYIIGYILGNTDSKKMRKICIVFVTLTLLILPLRIWVQYYNPVTLINFINYFKIGSSDFISYHHGLIGISLFLIIALLFKKIKYNKLLYYSDKYSYYVYLVHQIFILKNYSLLNISQSLLLNILLIIIVTIISAIVLYYLTKLFNLVIDVLIKKVKYFKKEGIKID